MPHISSRGRCPTPKPVQASPSKPVCKAEPGWAGVCKDLKAGEVFTGSHHIASPSTPVMPIVFISPQTGSSPRAGPPFPDATQAAAICLAPTTGCQSLSWAWSCAPGSGVAGGPTSLTFHSKALSPAPGPKLIRCVYCLHRHPDPFSQELWETAPFVLILQMGNRGSRESGD